MIGAKPAAVCRWIFELLGAGPADTLDDLYPGSGAVSRAWAAFTGARPVASLAGRRDGSRPARTRSGPRRRNRSCPTRRARRPATTDPSREPLQPRA